MVGQLLKDIVEAAERPNLSSKSASYDRFGFRIFDADANESSLEEKAERLRQRAEDETDSVTAEVNLSIVTIKIECIFFGVCIEYVLPCIIHRENLSCPWC